MKRWTVPCAFALALAWTTSEASPLLELMERNTVTVSFARDSAILSDVNKGALNALLGGRDQGLRGSKAAVAAWSDQAFPGEGEKLARRDVELARERADAVVEHLRTLSRYREVEVVNMARREGLFSRFISTKAAKVQAAFEGEGGPHPWARHEAAIFQSHGAPGKAVVIVYDEAETLAH